MVEIQLHHAKFVSIREDMGGHYIYSIFRSLVEGVEVTFGKEDAERMIAAEAPNVENVELVVPKILILRRFMRRFYPSLCCAL